MKRQNQQGWAEVIAVALLSCVIIFGASYIISQRDGANPRIQNNYIKVCLDGHTYWQANFDYGQVLALKVNDDGTPVKCYP